MSSPSIPLATYRLQFNRNFTFSQAADLVPYLAALGISHCYSSPFLRARPGSMHGYDIIDHNSLNPEVGSPQDFDRFVDALHRHGMGQISDIVPNHMGVLSSDNGWWLDVLENGEASPYAEYFDIDWQPLKDELKGKVLVPVLGDQYGAVLDKGELKLMFDSEKGEFSLFYGPHRFPINPREYPRILSRHLDRLGERLGAQDQSFLELQSLIAGFNHLPGREETDAEKKEERLRDKEIHKRRLAELCARSAEIREYIEQNTREISGRPGAPSSFDDLHELIKAQAYRLAYWRVAADDVNYRRFFDINELAGLRMENPAVFEATHRFVLDLLRQGKINGLRIDHPDGLYDPEQYFRRLQRAATKSQEIDGASASADGEKSAYVVIEKILTGDERLRPSWPVYGTTGYDFTNLVNGLFVDPESAGRMDRVYRGFIGERIEFESVLYECKKLVMDGALTSELNVLSSLLARIALAERHTCDFTLNSLREALSEIIAHFPVYRTYITGRHVSETDRRYIEQAVGAARRRSSVADPSVFDFVRDVLLTSAAENHSEPYRRAVIHFAMKFQQFTGVVMAKGMEDTSFYRFHRLTSLNEVGGDPQKFGVQVEEFDQRNADRAREWPASLLATSTHDTKRSEDVRARINVLSEVPALWRRNIRRWRELNRGKKRVVDGVEAPSPNDEYLLYQTLTGAWPLESELEGDKAGREFCERIQQYMLKAAREAKERTSWANSNTEYEAALTGFVTALLDPPDANFLAVFLPFQQYVSRLGMLNSLSQTLIKLTAPGVPDFYQGSEVWDLSLVDPDNRRAVDYARRSEMLAGLQTCEEAKCGVKSLVESMSNGRIKLYLIWKALTLRRQQPALFQEGEYVPLTVKGARARHLVAFARRKASNVVIVAVPRFCAQLLGMEPALPLGPGIWQDTALVLPDFGRGPYHNLLSGASLAPEPGFNSLQAEALLSEFPAALLVSW